MSIGGDMGGVAHVSEAFAEFAEAQAVPTAAWRAVSVALDELLINTISYGLDGRPDGEATVEITIDGDRLVATLSDNGVAFDPFSKSAPDTTLAIEDRPIGGQGIHLVRRLMDDARYERRAGKNVITLTKRLVAISGPRNSGGRIMEISTRTRGDASIVAIKGKLDSVTSPQAQQTIEGILSGGAKKLAVDFSALDYVSSAGLRVLLGAAKQLRASGGGLRMFGLNDTVREVFEISGFSSILSVYGTEAEAVEGF